MADRLLETEKKKRPKSKWMLGFIIPKALTEEEPVDRERIDRLQKLSERKKSSTKYFKYR
jgi:hypothetical protein